ncbi:hypothetical protein CBL_07927 [Carabus blaptoides fortunei]
MGSGTKSPNTNVKLEPKGTRVDTWPRHAPTTVYARVVFVFDFKQCHVGDHTSLGLVTSLQTNVDMNKMGSARRLKPNAISFSLFSSTETSTLVYGVKQKQQAVLSH